MSKSRRHQTMLQIEFDKISRLLWTRWYVFKTLSRACQTCFCFRFIPNYQPMALTSIALRMLIILHRPLRVWYNRHETKHCQPGGPVSKRQIAHRILSIWIFVIPINSSFQNSGIVPSTVTTSFHLPSTSSFNDYRMTANIQGGCK